MVSSVTSEYLRLGLEPACVAVRLYCRFSHVGNVFASRRSRHLDWKCLIEMDGWMGLRRLPILATMMAIAGAVGAAFRRLFLGGVDLVLPLIELSNTMRAS